MSKTLTVSYDLKPPAETPIPDSYHTSKVHEIAVKKGVSQQDFYKALRDAAVLAKSQIGQDLTVWRDAVGILENAKEPKKEQKEEEEEEEDEEGEE